MSQLLQRRFGELESQAIQVAATKAITMHANIGRSENVDRDLFLAWCVKVKNLLSSACGPDSEHYRAFVEAEGRTNMFGNISAFQQAHAVFGAAKEDFEGGYLTAFRNIIQAELFGNELEQARELFQAGYFVAAAVIAGVVLETTLRQMCAAKQIPIGKLDKMNADLMKAGQYNSIVHKQVTSLAAIRNSAAHGATASFTKEDVHSMIEDVERLVGTWLS